MKPEDASVSERQKPVLYTAAGEPIVVKKPFGFANHPDVPTAKLKAKGGKP